MMIFSMKKPNNLKFFMEFKEKNIELYRKIRRFLENLESNSKINFDEIDIIFQSEETIDKSIGYCVASEWEIPIHIYEERVGRNYHLYSTCVQDKFIGDGVETYFVLTEKPYWKRGIKIPLGLPLTKGDDSLFKKYCPPFSKGD